MNLNFNLLLNKIQELEKVITNFTTKSYNDIIATNKTVQSLSQKIEHVSQINKIQPTTTNLTEPLLTKCTDRKVNSVLTEATHTQSQSSDSEQPLIPLKRKYKRSKIAAENTINEASSKNTVPEVNNKPSPNPQNLNKIVGRKQNCDHNKIKAKHVLVEKSFIYLANCGKDCSCEDIADYLKHNDVLFVPYSEV